MNDDPTDFERELRGLKPLRPSGSLEERLSELLDARAELFPPLPWYQRLGFTRPLAALAWTLAMPATAALAVMAVTGLTRPANGLENSDAGVTAVVQSPPDRPETSLPASASTPFESAVASNVLYQTRDEGVVLDETRAPMRRVRVRSQDTFAWRNPQTGAQWEVSYPREDVLQLPIHAE